MPILEPEQTYPGTNLLKRLCYGCDELIFSLDDMWLDYDSNCAVCGICRSLAHEAYGTEREWLLSIVPVTPDMVDINEMEEG